MNDVVNNFIKHLRVWNWIVFIAALLILSISFLVKEVKKDHDRREAIEQAEHEREHAANMKRYSYVGRGPYNKF